jgi:hypothetical protein
MIGRLILRHEVVHSLTKPLLITITTVSLVLNILAFQMAQEGTTSLLDGQRGVLAQFAFLVPLVMVLMLAKAGNRCRRWEAGLPLAARPLWWSHLLAVACSILLLLLVTTIAFIGFGILIDVFGEGKVFDLAVLIQLVARPLGASLAAVGLLAVWRPVIIQLTDEPGWSRHRFLMMAVAGALLGLLISLPPVFSLLPVTLAAVMAWRAAAALPATMALTRADSGDHEPGVAAPRTFAGFEVKPSPRVVRLTIIRTLFKWPLGWLALGPFVFLFGIIMSGHDILGIEGPYFRFLNFFMSVYILVASANHFMENLHKLDHLPIARRTLLRWLVVPVAGVFVLGYGVGRVLEAVSPAEYEKIVFENGNENYGLKLPPEYFSFTTSKEPHLVSAPWGEAHEVVATPVMKGLPGLMWKAYDTPAGSSPEFVAWQISRAASAVYGLDLEPEEIAARYLESDLLGRVTVREPGLTLAADYPGARAQSLGPVLPLLVGGVLLLLLLLLVLYFRVFRPGVTIKKARVIFWLLMGGLMGLHIGGYIMFIVGWTSEWLITGFWLGRMRELGGLGPIGYAGAWLVMALLLGVAWRWTERSFHEVEAPSS